MISGKQLVIACGGTGGHLFPGIAVAEEWRRQGGDVCLLISEKQIDALAAEGFGHLRFVRMPSVAMPGILSPRMPGFLLGFLKSFFECRRLLRGVKADAVLGMGGFTSTPPLMAGNWLGLPTFVHESNAIPGKANRINAKFSRVVLTGFEDCAPLFNGRSPVVTVGTPLRPALVNRPTREEGRDFFGLRPEGKVLLVMGGSQGARRINELVAASLSDFEQAGIQVLHISGPSDFDLVNSAYESHPGAGVLRAFCSEMQFALAAADLAVCRAGASTLSELAHFGLPSIMIPYPFAAEDHQTKNAAIFQRAGAAELWAQSKLDESTFCEQIRVMITDDEKLRTLSDAAFSLDAVSASERVCQVISDRISKLGQTCC